MKRTHILLLSFLLCGSLFAQPGTKGAMISQQLKSNAQVSGGTVYALIIGISNYQHFPSLKFADKDAIAFYHYLLNASGEKADTSNIRLLLNDKAKAGDIWRDFSWLTRKALKKGDKVFIYFSGHGDAANAEEAYLLAHDAPNEGDPNLYNAGGTFQVYNLKTKIKQLSQSGVQVVLITDACRTNELPGKEAGSRWAYNKIMEQQSGEIQMASCAANEKSVESTNWGEGRGVFSWHLINGLSGLADDDPEDGQVTLYELQKYVKSKVRNDTRNNQGIPTQNPMFCCNEAENLVLNNPTQQQKMQLIANLSKPVLPGSNTMLVANTNRSVLADVKKAAVIYAKFTEALNKENLLGTELSAQFHYSQLINSDGFSNDDKKELTGEYAAALVNFAQQRVNNYLSGKNQKLYSYDYFMKAAEALREAYQLLGPYNDQSKVIMKTRLLLEARATSAMVIFKDFHENKSQTDLMKNGLLKLDSASKITNSASDAVLYHTYSLVLQGLNDIPKAIYFEKEALKIAPLWKYPYNTLGFLYNKTGNTDSALYYYHACILIDPGYTTAYNNLGSMYLSLGEIDKAEFYLNRCISIDPDYLNARVNKGLLLYRKQEVDSAILCWQGVIAKDSNFSNAHFNLANLFYNLRNLSGAATHYNECVRIDSSFAKAHFILSCIYSNEKKLKQASYHFEQALKNGYRDKSIDDNSDLENFRRTDEFIQLRKRYLLY
ncbi:MAG: tetratricopeptide repeat protein [Bacteroidota bacterium]